MPKQFGCTLFTEPQYVRAPPLPINPMTMTMALVMGSGGTGNASGVNASESTDTTNSNTCDSQPTKTNKTKISDQPILTLQEFAQRINSRLSVLPISTSEQLFHTIDFKEENCSTD